MAATYTLIAATYLSAESGNVTFSSIPTTYTDLRIVGCMKASTTSSTRVRINNNTFGITYGFARQVWNNSSILYGFDGNGAHWEIPDIACLQDITYNGTWDFIGVNNSLKNFQVLYRGSQYLDTSYQYGMYIGGIAGTSQTTCTQISLILPTANWRVGTRFQLFGITKA